MKLFYDESGNTGVDLLNSEQPVFCLASTSLDADVAAKLIAPLVRPDQKEAKYSKLKGSRQGQANLINFFSSPELTLENSKFTLADKNYYLITHIVDKLIEPPLYENGIDLYENDAHVGLVNLWYYTGDYIFPGQWKHVQRAFLKAIRQRDHSSFNQFDRILAQAYKHARPDSNDIATGLFLARGRLDEFIGVYQDLEVFDPAVDSFISLTHKWMQQSPDMFHVTHDQSKPLRRSEKFLRTLMTPLAPRIIGYGNRQAELPLRISDFDFGDSVAHPQLQVADIIAGAAIDCLLAWSGKRPAQAYHTALKETQLHKLFCDGMLPLIENIGKENPSRPGEKNLVDGSAEFLAQAGYFKPINK
jgi:hypothetical protein